ncbi:MAG: hypothetical protein JWM58_1853 [Rhizobium sp.]|nr:hypothetical protein [Rhizobium sp.]
MHKMYVMYNLKPGVTMEQYKLWSREIDQRITPGQPGMIRFEVYEMIGADNGEPFVQIVEDIEVEDFDAWMETCRREGMAYVESTLPNLIDESSRKIMYGKRIIADLPHGSRPPVESLNFK